VHHERSACRFTPVSFHSPLHCKRCSLVLFLFNFLNRPTDLHHTKLNRHCRFGLGKSGIQLLLFTLGIRKSMDKRSPKPNSDGSPAPRPQRRPDAKQAASGSGESSRQIVQPSKALSCYLSFWAGKRFQHRALLVFTRSPFFATSVVVRKTTHGSARKTSFDGRRPGFFPTKNCPDTVIPAYILSFFLDSTDGSAGFIYPIPPATRPTKREL